MAKEKDKKNSNQQPDPAAEIIDLTSFFDEDIMETDILGSYTGTGLDGVDYSEPEQDPDDL
ncbi:MAG: hypothetical protein LIO46_00805 [Clostridiales bacterium]|nr:hypothetical protein [Clostridiales bacterium]